MVSPRKSDPSGKKVSKLYVEPAELARKLIKELEGTKVPQGGQTWVRDQYTVFLCREDFARFRSHLDELVRKLESHMEKHVQARRYGTSGAITIELTMDPDLKPGYFGVLAERADVDDGRAHGDVLGPGGRSAWDVPEDVDYDDDYEDWPRARWSAWPFCGRSWGRLFGALHHLWLRRPVPVPMPPMPGAPPVLGPSYGRPFPPPPGADRPPSGPPPLAGSSLRSRPIRFRRSLYARRALPPIRCRPGWRSRSCGTCRRRPRGPGHGASGAQGQRSRAGVPAG